MMPSDIRAVQDTYDQGVLGEWERLLRHPVEFDLTCRYLHRYIKPGERVLDIGGGPGRYALHLARMGCQVTLLDLSPGNIAFAQARAAKENLAITALSGDARKADALVKGPFDHVLLMGPLYHLPEEEDRVRVVAAAGNLLKAGGVLFASFISAHAGMIDLMKHAPEILASNEREQGFMDLILQDKPFAGIGFTLNYFIRQEDIGPFMAGFPFDKLHIFGQEGMLAPCEGNILSQPKEVYDRWLDLAEGLCEREKFLSWSEHLMYVGRKL